MDYRHDRGGGIGIPHRIRRHLYKLRRVGVALMLAGLAVPWLIALKFLKSTVLSNFLAYGLMLLGPILYLIGLSFDTHVDRK